MNSQQKTFVDRAAAIGLDVQTRNQIYSNPTLMSALLKINNGFFQLEHCYKAISGELNTPNAQPQGHLHVVDMQNVYQQAADQPQYIYATEQTPVYRKTAQGNNAGILTATLISLIVLAGLFLFFRISPGASPMDFSGVFAGNAVSSTTFPPNCNVTLSIKDDQISLNTPKPALTNSETIICFTSADYQSLKLMQKQITLGNEAKTVNGAEYLGYFILNNTAVNAGMSGNRLLDDATNAKVLEIMNSPEQNTEADSDILLSRLPAYSISAHPTPTATYYIAPTEQQSQSVIPTSTPPAMIMEVVPTTTLGPLPAETIAYLVENYGTLPTATLGPMSASEVNRLVMTAQAQAAQATPTPQSGSLSGSQVNSIMLTSQAQNTPNP